MFIPYAAPSSEDNRNKRRLRKDADNKTGLGNATGDRLAVRKFCNGFILPVTLTIALLPTLPHYPQGQTVSSSSSSRRNRYRWLQLRGAEIHLETLHL
jgi:hypothetical protein